MAVDLAPGNPYGLALAAPVLGRAGLGGAGLERLAGYGGLGALVSDALHASATRPLAWHETPAGLLWPAGGRAAAAARRDLARWSMLALPVIVALAAAAPPDLAAILEALDLEGLDALLLDITAIARPEVAAELIAQLRRVWRKPLLLEVAADAPWLAELAQVPGCDALILGRGGAAAVATPAGLARGWLAGPAAHPALLAAYAQLAPGAPWPLVVSAATLAEARAFRALPELAPPAAFILDVGLWSNPGLAAQIASLP